MRKVEAETAEKGKSMRKHRGLIGAMLVSFLPLPISAQEDGCRDVLVYSARTETLETYDLGIAARTYEQYCENDSVRSGTEFNAGLDTIIKAVPIKFSLGSGSTEERLKAFCKTFDSEYKRNEATYRQISQVVNETTNAWLACKTLAAQGVLFRPRISSTQVIIEGAHTNAAPASVEGVTYDPKLLTCTVPNSDSSKTRTAANGMTTKALTDAYWPITCLRLPQSTPNETIYPKADISVGTTRGAFLLPVAAEASYPYQWSSDLQRQLNELRASTETKVTVAAGGQCIIAAALKLQLCWGTQKLTPGDPKWTRSFAFTFAKPFAASPNVMPGINTYSAGSAPAVYYFEITPTGYHGAVNNMLNAGGEQDGTVLMTYLAIGPSQ